LNLAIAEKVHYSYNALSEADKLIGRNSVYPFPTRLLSR